MQAITLEVIVEAVFGVRGEERQTQMRDQLRETLEMTGDPRSVLALLTARPERMYRWRYFQRELDPVNELVLDEIRRRRAGARPRPARRHPLDAAPAPATRTAAPMSDAELRDELMTLLVAGHETTATALAWALERLVRHPEKLARLAEEAAAGEDAYADAVAKETLRLRPVIPMVVRKLKEPMEIGGRLLPAGVAAAPVDPPHAPPAGRLSGARALPARSASSSSRRAPTPGSRSAAACAAAWAPASRCSRCGWCSPRS